MIITGVKHDALSVCVFEFGREYKLSLDGNLSTPVQAADSIRFVVSLSIVFPSGCHKTFTVYAYLIGMCVIARGREE